MRKFYIKAKFVGTPGDSTLTFIVDHVYSIEVIQDRFSNRVTVTPLAPGIDMPLELMETRYNDLEEFLWNWSPEPKSRFRV